MTFGGGLTVGEGKKQDAAMRRERDQQVIGRLRSDSAQERADGWAQVEQFYRKPLAQVLGKIARRCTSAAYESILNVNLRVDESVFDEVWQDTKVCLCQNICKETFKFKGNLLAYLVTIALRRIVNRWRKERRYVKELGAQQFAGNGLNALDSLVRTEEVPELLKVIKRYYNTLTETDKMALQTGMRLATDEGFKMKVFVEKMQHGEGWSGDYGAISRRYRRLLEKLRKFLEEEGYDV